MDIGEPTSDRITTPFASDAWGEIDRIVNWDVKGLVVNLLTNPLREGIVVGIVSESRRWI